MTYAFDASAIIAALDSNDTHHAQASATILALDAGADSFFAHPLTIAECLVAAERNEAIDAMLRAIADLGVKAATIDPGCPPRLARLRVSTRLRLPDCCVLDVALEHQASLITFDDRLAIAARAASVAVLPTPS